MDIVHLPQEIRRCPHCHEAGLKAQRATRGGSWGGQAVRFLFCCDFCGYQILIESERSRWVQAFSGAALVLSGGVLAFLLDGPGNLVALLLLVLPGAVALWDGSPLAHRSMAVVGQFEGVPAAVEIEAELFLSEEERRKAYRRNRYASYVIYGVLLLTAVVLLLDFFADR
ncbi:hypothetical protein [uncultured Cohaesibacter sp.]|uniref:hypothetical protein n=1 Tax=uncultured Cohaesibacter sp. TaxID=1002546 RepID=UPI002931DC69|nr:hypothetical protein [uncultured Cohaesibacter sp.]